MPCLTLTRYERSVASLLIGARLDAAEAQHDVGRTPDRFLLEALACLLVGIGHRQGHEPLGLVGAGGRYGPRNAGHVGRAVVELRGMREQAVIALDRSEE